MIDIFSHLNSHVSYLWWFIARTESTPRSVILWVNHPSIPESAVKIGSKMGDNTGKQAGWSPFLIVLCLMKTKGPYAYIIHYWRRKRHDTKKRGHPGYWRWFGFYIQITKFEIEVFRIRERPFACIVLEIVIEISVHTRRGR